MMRAKVRFNLGKGPRYMTWKITYPDGGIEYYKPTEVQLIMNGCQLINQKPTAEKIFNGAMKSVCAWVLCEHVSIKTKDIIKSDLTGKRLHYNPRIQPNWVLEGKDADNTKHKVIHTVNHGLYLVE